MHTINKVTGPDGLSVWLVGISIDVNYYSPFIRNEWELFDNELAALIYIDALYIFAGE